MGNENNENRITNLIIFLIIDRQVWLHKVSEYTECTPLSLTILHSLHILNRTLSERFGTFASPVVVDTSINGGVTTKTRCGFDGTRTGSSPSGRRNETSDGRCIDEQSGDCEMC